MSFLEDIGRSGQLGTSTGNLLNLARQTRVDNQAAVQQGELNRIRQEELGMQQEQLGMQRESHEVSLAVDRAQFEKLQKEEAWNNQVLTLDQIAGASPVLGSPSVKKRLIDLAGPAIITDEETGVQGITRGDMAKIQQSIIQDVGFQKVLDEDYLRDLVSQKTQLMSALQNPEAKLKPEQIQQGQAQLKEIESQISMILTHRPLLDRAIAEKEANIKLMEARVKTEEAQAMKERAMAGLYNEREKVVGKTGGGSGGGSGSGRGGGSSFDKAYAQYSDDPANAPISRAEFRQQYWLKQNAGAAMSDSGALANIKEFAGYDPAKTRAGYNEYIRLRKSGMRSSEALDVVSQKLANVATGKPTDRLDTATVHKPVIAEKDFSALWK